MSCALKMWEKIGHEWLKLFKSLEKCKRKKKSMSNLDCGPTFTRPIVKCTYPKHYHREGRFTDSIAEETLKKVKQFNMHIIEIIKKSCL